MLQTAGTVKADTQSNLEITNNSGVILDFTHEQLMAMPKTTEYTELYCYGSLAIYGNWTGVLLSYLLAQTRITPEVSSIQFSASDGYTVSIPTDLAMQPQIIIAYEINGQPLAEGLRLIVPGANGATWISLITSITMSTSGTDYPAAGGAGIGKITATTPEPIPQSTPQPQGIAPQSTLSQNTSSIQAASPTNVTGFNQSTPKSQLLNSGVILEAVVLTVVFVVSIMFFSAAGYMKTHRHKRELAA